MLDDLEGAARRRVRENGARIDSILRAEGDCRARQHVVLLQRGQETLTPCMDIVVGNGSKERRVTLAAFLDAHGERAL